MRHESAFPRKRLVKRCTTRFRGNALDVVASDVTSVRCPCLRHESMQASLCQSCAVDDPGIVVQPVGEGNFEASVQFLVGWVSDGAAEARAYLAGHS
jgi:hypothetical protein